MQSISRADAKALGLVRFFTGKPCVRGHLCERRVCNGRCVDCDRETSQRLNAARASNPEYIQKNRARATAWQKANQTRYRENQRRWREHNIESRLRYDREWKKAKPDAFREWLRRTLEADPGFHKKRYARRKVIDPDYAVKSNQRASRWREQNPERKSANDRAWREANPEKCRRNRTTASINRRARQKGAGNCQPEVLARIRSRAKCEQCGTDTAPMEIDHIIPLSRGGTNDEANLQLLCRPCNRRKAAKLPRSVQETL